MGQQTVMVQSFLMVTACVLVIMVNVYFAWMWELRKLRRTTPVDADEVEMLLWSMGILRRVLWVLAIVVGLALLVTRDMQGG